MMRDIMVAIIFLLLFLGAIFGGIFLFGHFYGQYQCGNFAQITGKQTRWASFDSCYIKSAQGWERWDEYKLRAAASEGLKSIAK